MLCRDTRSWTRGIAATVRRASRARSSSVCSCNKRARKSRHTTTCDAPHAPVCQPTRTSPSSIRVSAAPETSSPTDHGRTSRRQRHRRIRPTRSNSTKRYRRAGFPQDSLDSRSRGGEKLRWARASRRLLARLITQRSQVQILPPQPIVNYSTASTYHDDPRAPGKVGRGNRNGGIGPRPYPPPVPRASARSLRQLNPRQQAGAMTGPGEACSNRHTRQRKLLQRSLSRRLHA
jgi:hypothetical protein